MKIKFNIKTILIIILIIIVILFGLYFFLIYMNSSNTLKRSLKKNNYICEHELCTKEINNTTYTINYKNTDFNATSLAISLTVDDLSTSLIVNNSGLTCTYSKDVYVKGELIDNTFTYTNECQKYINEANEMLDIYNEAINK